MGNNQTSYYNPTSDGYSWCDPDPIMNFIFDAVHSGVMDSDEAIHLVRLYREYLNKETSNFDPDQRIK